MNDRLLRGNEETKALAKVNLLIQRNNGIYTRSAAFICIARATVYIN